MTLGETSLENTALLCRRHHTEIHKGHWTLRLAADDHPELIPPTWVDPAQKPIRNGLHHFRRTLRI